MQEKLSQFLDQAFAPYGDFPARSEVTKELLANLNEKYQDLKEQGMSDDEAYQATVDSFGDVKEIMDELSRSEKEATPEPEPSLRETLKNTFRQAKATMGISKFGATVLKQADLSDSDLSGQDFSYSALMGTNFDRSNLASAKFRAAALKDTSFVGANIRDAVFAASDLQNANFTNADLAGTKFRASALKNATFTDAKLTSTDFGHSDLGGVTFDSQELNGVVFNGASLKSTSFKNATLHDVSFHHTEVKHTIFDGTKMDKVTYALLKGAGAVVDTVEIL
ncbi:MAG TPA: pentapeptide repeat-containing protein [Candidatus Saccharimonadia bacterium]|nr:pentapeptide repeat-containing protein [Candidatus Saccharimonadia bacterium]